MFAELQAVYKLDVATTQLQRIVGGTTELLDYSFARDSSMFLIGVWEWGADCCLQSYTMDGTALAVCRDPHVCGPNIALAVCSGGRVAAGCAGGFTLWDMGWGGLVCTLAFADACAVDAAGAGGAGLLATDAAGEKVAFWGVGTLTLHLVDVLTAEILYDLQLEGAGLSASVGDAPSGLIWGLNGWVVLSKYTGNDRAMHVLQPEAGSNACTAVLNPPHSSPR